MDTTEKNSINWYPGHMKEKNKRSYNQKFEIG